MPVNMGAHVHVTVNIIPHEDDFDGLDDYLRQLESIGVHAVIVASPTIVRRVKTVAPKLEVHLSTQMSSTNSQAVRFYRRLGADRVCWPANARWIRSGRSAGTVKCRSKHLSMAACASIIPAAAP